MSRPPSDTPGRRSTSHRRTTISAAVRRPRSWDWRRGRPGTSRRRTGSTPRAWPGCSGPVNLSDVLGAAIALADIRIAQGRLRDAMRTYEQALQLATGPGSPALRGTADMYVGMSDSTASRDDLHGGQPAPADEQGAGRAQRVPAEPVSLAGRDGPHPEGRGGSRRRARRCSTRRSGCTCGDFSPDVRPVPALRARVWVAQGRLADALGWARERGLSAEDDLSYLREFEHVTLARVLLARSERDGTTARCDEAIGSAGAPPAGRRRRARGRAASSRSWCCRRSRTSTGRHLAPPGAAGTRTDAGRAGGLRPDLRRRGPAHGGPARRRPRSAGSPRGYVRRLLTAFGPGRGADEPQRPGAWSSR